VVTAPEAVALALGITAFVPVEEFTVGPAVVPAVHERFVATLTCAPAAMPSSFVLSAATKTPAFEVVAAGNVVFVPVDDVTVTVVALTEFPKLVATLTCAPASIPFSFVLSAEVKRPAADVVAAGRVAFVPVELFTVPVEAAAVYVRFVAIWGAVFVTVIVPLVVIGEPEIEIPAPAVAATEVTVPVFAVAPVATPSNLVLSAVESHPAVVVVATGIVTFVPVDEVTVRVSPVPVMPRFVPTFTCAPASMPSSFVLSVEVSKPAIEVVAAGSVAFVPVDEVTVPVDAADV
jgi:hypothetical protein